MSEDNGKVKGQELRIRAENRLEWINDHTSDMGCQLSDLRHIPADEMADLLEEAAELARDGSITVAMLWFVAHRGAHPRPKRHREYLKSQGWRTRRARAIERADGRCQVCNSAEWLDVHHRTYERVGHEEPADLIVLCRDCHQIFHANGRLAQ